MNGPKLFQVLYILQDEDWIAFKKFVLQYTRDDSVNYKCLQLLYSYRKRLDEQDFDKKMMKKHFSELKPKAFSNLLSKLLNWLEEYLAIKTFREDKRAVQLALVNKYNRLGLFKISDQVKNKFEKGLTKSPKLNQDHNKYLAALLHEQYFSSNPAKAKATTKLLEKSSLAFLAHTKEKALLYLMETYNSSKLRDHNYVHEAALHNIIKACPDTELSKILEQAALLVKEPTVVMTNSVLEQLESEAIDPSSDLYLIISILLRRAATELWLNGYLKDSWLGIRCYQVSMIAVDRNENQKFTPTNLFNVVSTLGINLSYEETEEFILKWVGKVHTSYPNSVLKYSKALNAFRHDKYDMMPELLTGLEFDSYSYKIISNAMMVIAQYKLGQDDLMQTLSLNLRKQIKRNESIISKDLALMLTNLLAVIRLISKSNFDKKVKIEFENFQPIFFKTWILKELEEKSKGPFCPLQNYT